MDKKSTVLAQKLRKLREIKGARQEDLARLLHISRTGYQAYEAGRNEPSKESLLLLSQYYGISPDALMDDSVDVIGVVRETQTYNRRREDDEQLLELSRRMTYEEFRRFMAFGRKLIRKRTAPDESGK